MNLLKYVIFPLFSLISIANAQAPLLTEPLQSPTPVVIDYKDTLASLAKKYAINANLASNIIECESQWHPHATGTMAYVGIDVGLWQINTYFHSKTATKMGLDIYNPVDNLEYGVWLLSKYGTQPWSATRKCWEVL